MVENGDTYVERDNNSSAIK
ncbi:hypothetical protein A2U01_0076581, partial [Trifolium medium]|nr:hypothetical protein [Trifolium medium]